MNLKKKPPKIVPKPTPGTFRDDPPYMKPTEGGGRGDTW